MLNDNQKSSVQPLLTSLATLELIVEVGEGVPDSKKSTMFCPELTVLNTPLEYCQVMIKSFPDLNIMNHGMNSIH